MHDWQRQRDARAYLALADGAVFRGYSAGAPRDAVGEAVFNTGMTGYQEILSDPSYAGQFVCLTAPEIGNAGVNPEDMESARFHAEGLLVHALREPSNWRARESLADTLLREGRPALAGVDTRALAVHLRDHGAQKAFLCVTGAVPPEEGVLRARAWEGLDGRDSVTAVGCAEAYEWDEMGARALTFPHERDALPLALFKVVAYDFGLKWNILRRLRRAGCAVTVVPPRTPASEALDLAPDGVLLSNGPGDPAGLPWAVETVRALLGRVPLFGICLGHQLLARALGAETYRLPFGHHGCNHPVRAEADGRVLVSSQNHNFAVDADSLDPARAEATHTSLNDGSNEGLRAKGVSAFSVQFHPEAAPGPHDAFDLFAAFVRAMKEGASRK